MNNLRILARNIADTASLTAVPAMVSSGGLDLSNLQKQTERGRTARTTSLASQDFNLLWTSNQKVTCAGFSRHNWSTGATLRTLLYQGGSPSVNIYDSTALAAWATTGLNTDIDIHTEADFAGLKNTMQWFSELTTVQAATLRLLDAANPDGYVEQTRLWMGKHFATTYDPPFGGVDLTPMDLSVSGRSDDGTFLVDKRGKYRRLAIRLEFIPDADLPTMLAIARYLGKDRECFLSLFPLDASAKELYCQMACRLVESPTFQPLWTPDLAKTMMVFEET